MSLEPPPPFIARIVHGAAPGIWPAIIGSANAALAGRRAGVSSWYRSPERNRFVGGHPESQHQLGTAIDVVGVDRLAVKADLQRAGWVVVDYDSHVHAQAWPAGVPRRAGLLRAIGL